MLEDGPVLRVTMARPEQRNAFNPEMIAELTAVFEGLGPGRMDEARVVVLAGEGRIFSAGADLEWMRSMAAYSEEENVADALRLAALFASIRDCPMPVVARVQGAAMGGGSGLVAACDIAVAADSARFAFSEARLGLVPAVISPFVMPRIGASAARELFLTGEIFDADHAKAIGLVHRVVAEDALDEAVEKRVRALLKAGPEAQAAVKALVLHLDTAPEDARDYTAALIAARRASEEGREGMSAFLEGRKADWIAES